MFYSDYGVVIYANPIFAAGQLVREQPELAERFVRATLKGYQYAIEHPEEAGELSLKYDDTLQVAFQTATMEAQIPLIDTGDVPIGWMDESVWQTTLDVLLEQDVIASSPNLDTVYTNQFVEKTQ
jgi:ABC-type nitrate/sulfonate/bicarbonate transport system substrate-binding protein